MQIKKAGVIVITSDDVTATGFTIDCEGDSYLAGKLAALRWAISRLEFELEKATEQEKS